MTSRLCQNRLNMKSSSGILFGRTGYLRWRTSPVLLKNGVKSYYAQNLRPMILPGSRSYQTTQVFDATHRVKMPSLSPTMSEGTIIKWMKKEGETIAAGEVLCEIQTDKAVVSLDVDEDVVLAKILVPENKPDIKVGTLIALTVDEGDDWKSVEVPADAEAESSSSSSSSSAAEASPKEEKSGKSSESGEAGTKSAKSTSESSGMEKGERNDHLVGPAVKNYLRQYGIDPDSVSRTGPHGTVTKGDVLKHVGDNNMKPVSKDSSSSQTKKAGKSSGSSSSKSFKLKDSKPATYVDLEISNMRKTIAKRLLQSKTTIPHAYGTVQCNANNLIELRKNMKSVGLQVSVNDLVIKCIANTLTMNPTLNCTWDDSSSKPKHQSQADISVAVATPNGLITPIVSDAGRLDVMSIASVVRELAAKAKDGKLQPHEFMGGSFSISNLGMFGIHSFSAIINPPQCAILAVGGTITELGENGKPLNMVKCILSYNARAIEEVDAVKFLALFQKKIENINEMSMGVYNIEERHYR